LLAEVKTVSSLSMNLRLISLLSLVAIGSLCFFWTDTIVTFARRRHMSSSKWIRAFPFADMVLELGIQNIFAALAFLLDRCSLTGCPLLND